MRILEIVGAALVMVWAVTLFFGYRVAQRREEEERRAAELVPLEVLGLGASADAPRASVGFIQAARAHGWRVAAEWVPVVEDEEGELIGGFWSVLVYREERHGEELWHFQIDVGEAAAVNTWPERLDAFFSLADASSDASWDQFQEEQAAKATNAGALS